MLWLGQPQINATWVPASAIPPAAIEAYENGVSAESVAIEDKALYGQQSRMIIVSRPSTEVQKPTTKRSKTERPHFDVE